MNGSAMKYLVTTALKNITAFLPERPRKPSTAVIFCKVCGTQPAVAVMQEARPSDPGAAAQTADR